MNNPKYTDTFSVGDRAEVVSRVNGGKFPVGHAGTVTEVYGDKPTIRLDGARAALYGAEELARVPKS